MTTKQRIAKYLTTHPDANPATVAIKFNVSPGYVYSIRKSLVAEPAPVEPVTEAPARARQVGGDHYKNMGVEPWDVVDTWPIEQRIGAYRHGALKYLMRMGSKDEQLQEIKKAGHYIEKLIEILGEDNG